VTLLGCAAVSSLALAVAERLTGGLLPQRHSGTDAATAASARHRVFSAAAFTAFVLFYTFAGAPSLRLVPGLREAFLSAAVGLAVVSLLRRLAQAPRAAKRLAAAAAAAGPTVSPVHPARRPHAASASGGGGWRPVNPRPLVLVS
jgi:hypothetical protein